MRKSFAGLSLLFPAILIISCSKTGTSGDALGTDYSGGSGIAAGSGSPSGGSGNGGNPGGTPGTITAAEWNDLNNWDYWNNLLDRDTIKTFPDTWQFYTKNRVTVILKDNNDNLIHDAQSQLDLRWQYHNFKNG